MPKLSWVSTGVLAQLPLRLKVAHRLRSRHRRGRLRKRNPPTEGRLADVCTRRAPLASLHKLALHSARLGLSGPSMNLCIDWKRSVAHSATRCGAQPSGEHSCVSLTALARHGAVQPTKRQRHHRFLHCNSKLYNAFAPNVTLPWDESCGCFPWSHCCVR